MNHDEQCETALAEKLARVHEIDHLCATEQITYAERIERMRAIDPYLAVLMSRPDNNAIPDGDLE